MPKDTLHEEFEVDAQKLRSELDRIHDKATSSSESSSALGQLRKQVAEGLGCHKDALSIVERIDKMSDQKLSDFMRSFAPMYEVMAPQWQEKIADLVDRAEAQTSEMEKDMGE